jgi:flagellar FliJ protein
MARFKFQLEGVLEHRRNVEDQKQRALAAVQQEMQRLENELRELDRLSQGATADLRENRLIGRLDMSFLAAHRRFSGSVQRRAVALAQKMALVQREIDKARTALGEAAKQRKIIEKLRERQLERWKMQRTRAENEELDDIGMQLAYRQLGESADAQASAAGESL